MIRIYNNMFGCNQTSLTSFRVFQQAQSTLRNLYEPVVTISSQIPETVDWIKSQVSNISETQVKEAKKSHSEECEEKVLKNSHIKQDTELMTCSADSGLETASPSHDGNGSAKEEKHRHSVTQAVKRFRHKLEKKEVSCEICGKVFSRSYHLNRHKRTHCPHNDALLKNEPLFQCNICGKKFSCKSTLKSHHFVHTGEKPFTCHICGKSFSQTGLHYHLRHVHAGIRNHCCDICGRSFAAKPAMEDHRRVHTGERPYVCSTCGKAYKTKATLYIHSKIHTDIFPFSCSHCSKAFRNQHEMVKHLVTHTGEKPHTCDICGRGFRARNEMVRHRMLHSDEKPFICSACGLGFKQERYLKRHVKAHHTENGCPAQSVTVVNAFPDKQNLRRAEHTTEYVDVKTEETPDFATCTFCALYFASNSELADHLSVCHLQKVLHCSVCDEIFHCGKEKFQVHMIQHMSQTLNTDGAQANSNAKKYYFCKDCNMNFSTRKNFQKHLENHNSDLTQKQIINKACTTVLGGKADLGKQDVKVEENICHSKYVENATIAFSFVNIESVNESDVLVPASVQKPENMKQKCSEFVCKTCGKKYSRKCDMLKHVKLHAEKCDLDNVDQASDQTNTTLSDEIKVEEMDVSEITEEQAAVSETSVKVDGRRIYYCKLCGKQLTTSYTFKCHLRIHTGEKPYTCHVCGKQFRMRTLLTRHIRDSHDRIQAKEQDSVSKAQVEVDGRQVYHCSQCGKQLVTRYSYIRHQRIHTGEKPFTCHICGKQFRVQALMRRHIREVHERVRNHPCDICGRCFANSNARNDHRRIHTGERPYICQLCGKAFKTKASLFIHTKFHQDVFPHPCMLCDKRFRRRQQLNMHLLLHSGEKPHSCTYCGKSFRHNKTLKDHLLIHTNKDTFKCKICEKLFAQERYLKNHIRNHRKQVTSRS